MAVYARRAALSNGCSLFLGVLHEHHIFQPTSAQLGVFVAYTNMNNFTVRLSFFKLNNLTAD